MAKYPRRATNAQMTLITKSPGARNSFGERGYTDSTTSDDVLVQFTDGLEDPPAGNVRFRSLTVVTDPQRLNPRVGDEAIVNGVTYRILEVAPVYDKGEVIAHKCKMQERGA